MRNDEPAFAVRQVLNTTAETANNGSLFHLLILSLSHYKYEKMRLLA